MLEGVKLFCEKRLAALAKYRTAHGDAKTLSDVEANGGVDAWSKWDGTSGTKMPRGRRAKLPKKQEDEKEKKVLNEAEAEAEKLKIKTQQARRCLRSHHPRPAPANRRESRHPAS